MDVKVVRSQPVHNQLTSYMYTLQLALSTGGGGGGGGVTLIQ